MTDGTKPRPIATSDLLLYTSPNGAVKVGVLVRDESVWLTQRAVADLFGVGVPAITKHLKKRGQADRRADVESGAHGRPRVEDAQAEEAVSSAAKAAAIAEQ